MTEHSDSPTGGSTAATAPGDPAAAERPPLRRSRRHHVLAGVCGGLGRHFDLDPVIFRIVLGVLAATGGVGLIFYGFAWLLVPLEGEEENEAKKLLTGRVEGATLAALLTSLVGCALFLVMLDNGGLGVFSILVILAVGSAAYWSQKRRAEPRDTRVEAALAGHVRAEAPPETQAPPVPSSMSWWRDPLVKDGTTGPVGAPYLWGPEDAVREQPGPERPARRPAAAPDGAPAGAPTGHSAGAPAWASAGIAVGLSAGAPARPRGIGGRTFFFALLAGALGTGLTWDAGPLGTALQTGLACALAVFGLGIAVSAFRGRTAFGSLFLALVTAGLLMAATVLPRDIGTHWTQTTWRPASAAQVQPRYEAGTGDFLLDLSAVPIPAGKNLPVSVEVSAGRLKVVLPAGVAARAGIEVGVGRILLPLPGEHPDYIRIQHDYDKTVTLPPPAGTPPGGTLELRLKAGVGQVEVTRAS